MGIEEYADRIAEELHERVEHQRRVFRHLLSRGADASDRQSHCPLVDSKRLEVMRKKLIEILSEF